MQRHHAWALSILAVLVVLSSNEVSAAGKRPVYRPPTFRPFNPHQHIPHYGMRRLPHGYCRPVPARRALRCNCRRPPVGFALGEMIEPSFIKADGGALPAGVKPGLERAHRKIGDQVGATFGERARAKRAPR